MELIAEAGDATQAALILVVAHHDGEALSLAAWRFVASGEDETLAPQSPPTPLLPLRSGEKADADTLDAFIRTRAAGHSASARTQGIPVEDAVAALEHLHDHAALALDATAPPTQQVEALAAFTRGLDDDLLFSPRGLATTLGAFQGSGPAVLVEGSARRAQAKWGEIGVSLLRKADGWTLSALGTSD